MLDAGPDELIAAMATLRGQLPDTQTLTVRIDTEGSERIANNYRYDATRYRGFANLTNGSHR